MWTILRVSALLAAGVWASAVAVGQPSGRTGGEARAVAEAFGGTLQRLNIGAAAFQHLNNKSGYEIDWSTDGFLTYTDENFLGVFVAPLELPAGAKIYSICAFFYDTAPVGDVTLYLDAVKLADGFQTLPEVVPVIGPLVNDIDTGYGGMCSGAPVYTFRDFVDVDGDGYEEEIVHRLRVQMTETGEGRLAFGGVRVVWYRDVSPPPSTPSFADVPLDHPYFKWIEALQASGITAGCSPENFCPNAPLTRAQMAVFLAKALGLHWPY